MITTVARVRVIAELPAFNEMIKTLGLFSVWNFSTSFVLASPFKAPSKTSESGINWWSCLMVSLNLAKIKIFSSLCFFVSSTVF